MKALFAATMLLAAGCLGTPGGDDGSNDGATDDASTDDGGTDGGDDGGPVEGEPAELAGITAAHNASRAAHGVGPMVWNQALADLATGFIADCEFAHSSQGERSNVAGFGYIGENLYSSGGFVPSGQDVTGAWISEEADYNYADNSCSGVCGHYTQVVWADSTNLGCAIKACPSGSYIVSCEYGPGGNYVGERPY